MNKENCALKLVDEIILYYDARSKNIKNIYSVRHQQPWDLPTMLCSVYRQIYYWFFDLYLCVDKTAKSDS